ncbi:hypothetical protein [Amazonocrinis nigriterrae]|nr:hypothetical protein [Amazonocrinis nigriterrae]
MRKKLDVLSSQQQVLSSEDDIPSLKVKTWDFESDRSSFLS